MYEFTSRVRYTEVDKDCKMTMLSVLDYFQDCSVFHSEELHVGVDYLAEKKRAWVLNSWQVHFKKLPSLMEEIRIQTWPYEMKGFYGYRNFVLKDKEGNTLAYANSVWVHIDTETGRPVRIPDEIEEIYGLEPPLEIEVAERKIKLPEEFEEKECVDVLSSYIDSNQHMNNSKYVMAALEYLPTTFHVKEIRVEYKKAATLGDKIYPRVTKGDEYVVNLADENGKPYAIVKFI